MVYNIYFRATGRTRWVAETRAAATDEARCMTCMRCVDFCPTHARDFPTGLVRTVKEKMAPLFAGERVNKLYRRETL